VGVDGSCRAEGHSSGPRGGERGGEGEERISEVLESSLEYESSSPDESRSVEDASAVEQLCLLKSVATLGPCAGRCDFDGGGIGGCDCCGRRNDGGAVSSVGVC
jgi:hypothetical protein